MIKIISPFLVFLTKTTYLAPSIIVVIIQETKLTELFTGVHNQHLKY